MAHEPLAAVTVRDVPATSAVAETPEVGLS